MQAVLERAPALGVTDVKGPLPPPLARSRRDRAGSRLRDADFFYFDADPSWEAEDAVIRAGAELFDDPPVPVDIRNEARVHLRYADRFARRRLRRRDRLVRRRLLLLGHHRGWPLGTRTRAKTDRWRRQWPELFVVPWDGAIPPERTPGQRRTRSKEANTLR